MEKSHGKIFHLFLKKNEITVKDFADFLGKNKKTIYSWINQTNNFDKSRVLLINGILGISPELFGFKAEDFVNPFLDKKLIKKYSEMYLYPNESSEERENMYEAYFLALNKTINKTKNQLVVYDYLARIKGDLYHNERNEAHSRIDEYLNTIDGYINGKRIKYVRILALQISEQDRTKKNSIGEALSLLPLEKFKHIWNSYRNEKFVLYIQSRPVKLHSFAMIDEKCAVSVYEKYKFNGHASPDILVINESNNSQPYTNSSKIINRYNRTIRKLIKEGNVNAAPVWRVSKEDFQSYAASQKYEIVNEIVIKEKSFNEHKMKIEDLEISNEFDNINEIIELNKQQQLEQEEVNFLKKKHNDIIQKLRFMEISPIE